MRLITISEAIDNKLAIDNLAMKIAKSHTNDDTKEGIEGLKQSMMAIGDGKFEFSDYADRGIYTEKIGDKELKVFGWFTKPAIGGKPGFNYEVKVLSGPEKTAHYTPTVSSKSRHVDFNYYDADKVYTDKNFIKSFVEAIKSRLDA